MTAEKIVFGACALSFVAAAVYHAVGVVRPEWLVPAPVWRHALFVAINLAFAAGLLFRPRFFVWVFAALTVQQLWSHTLRAIEIWGREQRVDWPSVVVVLGMPVIMGLLVRDARRRATSAGR